MSFAYMPWYTGDYLRDTRHLSMAEHGAYLMLLAYCWDQKGPAPLDERQLLGIVNARSTDEIEALRRVLGEFFVRMEDGWYNLRIQKEIERMSSISIARKSAGFKGYQARAKQLLSKSLAIASTQPQPHTSLNLKLNTKPEKQQPTNPLPEWLDSELWEAWRRSRSAIKAKLTPKAESLLIAKLERMRDEGQNPKEIIEQSIERGWRGLFPVDRSNTHGRDEKYQRQLAVMDELTGRKARRDSEKIVEPDD